MVLFLNNNEVIKLSPFNLGVKNLKEHVNVLITGAGAPGAPGVIRSLKKSKDFDIRLIGVDASNNAVGFSMVDQNYRVPKAGDSNFIESVFEICKKEKVDVVLPLVTRELIKFAQYKQQFKEAGITVSVSEYEQLLVANDKGALIRRLDKANISTPKYEIVNSISDFKQAINNLDYPNIPVCFKPTVSNGSRGFRILDPTKDRMNILFNEKPNSTYISYKELFEIVEGREEIPELIVMEYLPGEEYSIDALVNNGKVITAIPRLREKRVEGISTQGIVVKEKDIIDYTTKIVEELGLHGNIGVQVRRDVNNKPKILEINPRIQGTIVHCTAAGVNLPILAVKIALDIDISPQELNVKWGTRMVRFWEEMFYDTDGSSYTF